MSDALVLARFPGRFLEEIDAIDWVRHNRALAAQNIIDAEDAWRDLRAHKGSKPTPELARVIAEHERLLRKAMGLGPEGEVDETGE
ncbi:MAG: hypothetical protein KAX65_00560 [Caldilineaceae bacterium]|nr:hypothetical protein [Caldilineaceae bacterium]